MRLYLPQNTGDLIQTPEALMQAWLKGWLHTIVFNSVVESPVELVRGRNLRNIDFQQTAIRNNKTPHYCADGYWEFLEGPRYGS